jgi:tetratricopeptide (TPR) repeat protein
MSRPNNLGRSIAIMVRHHRRVSTSVRLTVSLVSLAMLGGCVTTSTTQRTGPGTAAYGPYLRGLMLERTAQLPEALQAYHEALDNDHASPLLHVRIGATQLKLGQPEQALKSFNRALAIDPGHRDALRWVAMLYTSQGQLDDAVHAYERLVKDNPDDHFVLSTLADLYVMQNQLPRAIELYEQLAASQGSSHQLHFNLGVLHGRMGNLDESIRQLSRAIELSPNTIESRVALGLTLELAKRPAQAEAHYLEAIKIDPLNPRLYYHAARVAVSLKQTETAIRHYQTVLDLTPDDLDAMMALVRLWLSKQQYAAAQEFLAKQLSELDNQPELYLMLGLVYREADQPQEALRAFERAITLDNDSAQSHFYRGAQLERLGLKHEARRALRRAINLDPNYADALNYLGYMDIEDGANLQEARALIERALAIDPENGAYIDSMGWLHYQLGQWDQAITYLERAVKVLDSDPIVFEHLGDAYLKYGSVEEARAAWRKALELNTSDEAVRLKLEQLTPREANAPPMGTLHAP